MMMQQPGLELMYGVQMAQQVVSYSSCAKPTVSMGHAVLLNYAKNLTLVSH